MWERLQFCGLRAFGGGQELCDRTADSPGAHAIPGRGPAVTTLSPEGSRMSDRNRRIKLRVEDIEVQSFDALPQSHGWVPGTVHGLDQTCGGTTCPDSACLTCITDPNCAESGTCPTAGIDPNCCSAPYDPSHCETYCEEPTGPCADSCGGSNMC